MPTYTFNSYELPPRISARTDSIFRVKLFAPSGTSKTIAASWGFKAIVRLNEGGRVLHTYSSGTNGGIASYSKASGQIQITLDQTHLPPAPNAVMELVEYQNGTSNDPSDRWRWPLQILGGSGQSY